MRAGQPAYTQPPEQDSRLTLDNANGARSRTYQRPSHLLFGAKARTYERQQLLLARLPPQRVEQQRVREVHQPHLPPAHVSLHLNPACVREGEGVMRARAGGGERGGKDGLTGAVAAPNRNPLHPPVARPLRGPTPPQIPPNMITPARYYRSPRVRRDPSAATTTIAAAAAMTGGVAASRAVGAGIGGSTGGPCGEEHRHVLAAAADGVDMRPCRPPEEGVGGWKEGAGKAESGTSG